MEQNVNFCGISGQLKNKKEEKKGRGNDVNTALINTNLRLQRLNIEQR